MSRRLPNRRIRLLLALFTLAFAATFGRAVWLQAVHAQGLDRLAQGQHHATVTVPAPRGSMVDRHGVDLAIGRRATTVYANPRHIADPRAAAVAVGRDLHVDPDKLYGPFADQSRGFVYVARKADAKRADLLKRRGIVGLGFYPEERRVYPQGPVAANVLGYAGIDNKGLSGLELALDGTLAGRPGQETVVRDPFGRAIDVIHAVPAVEGRDVRLTLDATLQANAESVLLRSVRRWGARAATAVVLDPHSGEILAMAAQPGFDANRFPETPKDVQRNRAVTDTYEPGSTLKVVTVAGALSDGLVTPSTSFTLEPKIHVADRVIHEAHRTRTERMTVAEILAQSSNVGTVTLAQLLGRDRLTSWLARFGFGRRTGNRLPRRVAGDPPELLVRLDDRDAPDRPRHRRHARADGGRLRRGRERRRLEAAAPPVEQPCEEAPSHLPPCLRPADVDDARTSSSRGRAPRRPSTAIRSPGRRAPRPSRIRAAATRPRSTWRRSSASSRRATPG